MRRKAGGANLRKATSRPFDSKFKIFHSSFFQCLVLPLCEVLRVPQGFAQKLSKDEQLVMQVMIFFFFFFSIYRGAQVL